MDAELEQAYQQIMQVSRAEDLFGTHDVVLPAEMLKDYLAGEYGKWKVRVDPEQFRNPDEIEIASDAFNKLDSLYQAGLERIARQHFGLPGYGSTRPRYAQTSFSIGANCYYKGAERNKSEWHQLYEGFLERAGMHLGEVGLKVVRTADENPLMQNELRILEILHEKSAPQWKHLPYVLERFRANDRDGAVYRARRGHTLTEVREYSLHREGVDQRDMIWMFDRMLSLLGYVHTLGVVHGSISPDTIVIQSLSHNVLLVDWSGAVYKPAVRGERRRLPVGRDADPTAEIWGAPEVKNGGEIGPWSDIYSLGKVMLWLVGGDPLTNQIPDSVEEPVVQLLRGMVHESRYVRPSDAWDLYEQENRIKDSLWKRKFRHFDMGRTPLSYF